MKTEKLTISITHSDLYEGEKPAFSPSIGLDFEKTHISIHEETKSLKGSAEDKNNKLFYVPEKMHKIFLDDANKIIKKYNGKPIHIASVIAYDVPLDEVKDTSLIKFVLKKLGK